LKPGSQMALKLGSETATLSMPEQGAGVAGVLIADPCIRFASVTSLVDCNYAEIFQTSTRTPALLNAFVGHNDTDFWGVLGDNWYDRNGATTARVFSQLGMETLQKPLLTVAGNHDYWVLSNPSVAMRDLDQFGYGHLQYHAQDTLAARSARPGSSSPAPFNLSIDPAAGHGLFGGGNLPPVENSIFYHQIGNLGFIGFSGAYPLEVTLPRLAEACAWLPSQPGLKAALLLGPWDKPGLGATSNTSTPGMYEHVRSMDGCQQLDATGRLKFVMGHTHCNVVHPHGHNGTGFMVAGQGMYEDDCMNYGVPVVDSTGGRLRMWYFPIVSSHERADGSARGAAELDDTYDEVHGCVANKGWRACTHFATLWLDQPLD